MSRLKSCLAILLGLVPVLVFASSLVEPEKPLQGAELDAFRRIPIQHEGRIKPLDTFARAQLLSVQQKQSIDGQPAAAWLAQLLVRYESAYENKDFKIRIPDVVEGLGLEPSEDHRYAFDEIRKGLDENMHTLHALQRVPAKDRSAGENQLADVYLRSLQYLELSRALSGFIPDITIENAQLAQQLGVEQGAGVSYYQVLQKQDVLNQLILGLNERDGNGVERTVADEALIGLTHDLQAKISDRGSVSFHIIPPDENPAVNTWRAPWELMDGRELSDHQVELMDAWQNLVSAMYFQTGIVEAAHAVFDAVDYSNHIDLEVTFNNADLFYRSLYFYIGAFLLILVSLGTGRKKIGLTASILAACGMFLHGAGLIMRMIIMSRPPVSTLYESIIFVGFIIVFFSLLLECRMRNLVGTLIAAISGSILHFIGFKYAADGDTLGMLVAVLNSNFWLATHVVTITIGYGASYIVGLTAHIYLGLRIFKSKDRPLLRSVFQAMVGMSVVALFFTTLGTILGGIWADQSWGRFWGWDPKENGAMLIVLWLLMMIHGRFSGHFKEIGFAVGLILLNICVAVAWFGVNLLSVGLHSYGFDDKAAFSLTTFCLAELVIAIIAGIWAKRIPATTAASV
jgi:ABC-type transport system involved in cytochrome c biogenesis permease subunit